MKELTLHLKGTSPDRLSIARLAQYLAALSELYGSPEHVHFEAVERGSAKLKSRASDSSYQPIVKRARQAERGVGVKSAISAFVRLGELMAEDGVTGTVVSGSATIIKFPRASKRPEPLVITEQSSVQGMLYSVGGKDETVPVRLEGADGETLMCESSQDMARQLGQHLYSQVRVTGSGEWVRGEQGAWRLKKLVIESYELLQKGTLRSAIEQLREIGPTQWEQYDNPHGTILNSRG